MENGSNGAPPPSIVNGGTSSAYGDQPSDFSRVLEALQAIYDPRSSNDTRRHASEFLEQAKQQPNAPSNGFTLALDTSKPPQLRHYGLSMLEHSIKYRWDEYTDAQAEELRNYVIQLAQNVAEADPLYLRNKVGQLWTEIAKRSWAAEWLDMDQQLVQLWQTSLHHQSIVLYVLETLSEEIFNREDAIAGLRGNELGRACVEIFTPAAVIVDALPKRETATEVRSGDEGWLKRLCGNLDWCLQNNYENDERVRTSAVKSMNTLRAAMPWVLPKALAAVQLVEHVCKALAVPVPQLQQASIEVLHAIYTRPQHLRLGDEEFVQLVCPMYTPGSVRLLSEVYNWTLSGMNINDLDEQKYTLCKKLSELAADLGNYIEQKPQLIPDGSDISGMFKLLFDILQNPSLVVSIPILHCWTKLLRSRLVRDSEAVSSMVGGLLEICCTRLMRYEAFPEDSEDPTYLFLYEDIDTIPERHAFLGNYRRFCADIVDVLVRRTPIDALHHILGQASSLFQNLYNDLPPFEPRNFSKHSTSVLRVDAQVTVIDAALKGYLKWLDIQGINRDPRQDERDRNLLEDSFERWCRQLLQAKFEDPEISKKVIQLMSTFSTKALPDRPEFARVLLEYILDMKQREDAAFPLYSDAVKDLERVCSLEMQKLAMMFADDFMSVYDALQRKMDELVASQATDERQRMAFSAFLFIIVHRTTALHHDVQASRLKTMLNQVTEAWANPDFTQSLSSFDSFCNLLGMARLPEFLGNQNFHQVADWSAQPLNDEGQAMQADILARSQSLPLRLTKTLLAASIEKLRDDSSAYRLAAMLWKEALPAILPNILQLVSHAQAFNNIDDHWSKLPPELQQVIRRLLTDRFWQAGISTESRDDFFARVSGSKSTYEGFASTVRGTIRQIRESSYYILYSLTRFQEIFYDLPGLPEPLSDALFRDAHSLSAHHLSVLLSVSTHIIEGCPYRLRAQFLPRVIAGLFKELDKKISAEWEMIICKIAEAGEDDNLTDEMKTESILRQLTYSSVSLVSQLLDFHRPEMEPGHDNSPPKLETMPWFILHNSSMLEPIVLFCASIIRVHDTRSVSVVVRVLRSIIPQFREKSPIHDFFCINIFKSAITSLHEPYFVDCQKDLATLIAAIIDMDDAIPREILLTLPGMGDANRVDKRLVRLKSVKQSDERLRRSIVLELLSSVRGVSIHEQGKIERAKPKKKTAFEEQYMNVDQPAATIVRGTSPALAGVADMFAES
ncbi:ARM repeat-containing protein [Delitschia confertaspora ATCC 74209]|uniref:ARM repeat-containing protein n=1 Tax=Delitschia confertaspora ATCC 74209 TaxID=1513339 RepID=A0A9P4JES1_9PLEO|nr:ARM repeat-containing protein [Delitschia confertaspora ATCC 74209]